MRGIVTGILLTGAVALSAVAAGAEDYPEAGKPIRLIVNNNVGGGTDISARLLAQGLEQQLGTTIVVENYGGAGGMDGVNRLLAAPADGYAIGFVPIPQAAMYYLDPERGGTFTRADIVPIAIHDAGPTALAVAADSPWNTLDDFIAEAKKRPGELVSASSSILATGHLSLLRLQEVAGIELNWTPMEQQGTAASSLLGGHIDLITDTLVELYPLQRNGDLKILAAFSEERLPSIPDVPTAREQGYDVEVTSTRLLIAPKGVPQEVVERVEGAVKTLSEDPQYQKGAADRSINISFGTAEQADALWQNIDEVFTPIVKKFREAQ